MSFQTKQRPRAITGCGETLARRRTVFVDCGSNTCRVLSDRIERGLETEFFAFEPQPDLVAHVEDVRRKHPSVPIHFLNKAVWVHDGTVNFYLATHWGPNYKGGSTLVEGKTTNQVDYSHPITVESIDFSRWIRLNFRKEDHLVIKMDIEGAEYAVLEKMVAEGTIDYVTELMVEFHSQKNETISQERHDALMRTLKSRVVLLEWQ